MSNRFILYIVMIFSFISCHDKQELNRIRVENYAIGDTIDPKDFFYENKMDSAVLVGDCISNPDLTVFTWFNTIVWIGKTIKLETEFDSISKRNSIILDQQPTVKELVATSKCRQIQYEWNDTVTGDRIFMEHATDSIGNFSGSIMIENEKFGAKLLPGYYNDTVDVSPVK